MSFKLLLPTFRTRERFVRSALEAISRGGAIGRAINVGAGEGDLDALIASFAGSLDSCDINADDVAHAQAMNASVTNASYSVQNAEALTFEPATFDVVVCLEVIEHVGSQERLVAEIARVLRPGGSVILTAPSVRFPASYDPINRALGLRSRDAHVPLGAYGYGHAWLPDERELEGWFAGAGLEVTQKARLSGALVGAVECYWPGVAQRLLKPNARNTAGSSGGERGARPSRSAGDPPFVGLVDALIATDRALFGKSDRSIGLGYVLRSIDTRRGAA